MDTNQTIIELQKLSLDLKNQAEGIKANEESLLKRAEGIDLAVSQLQEVLQTQILSLTKEQLNTIPEVATIVSRAETAEALVETKNVEIATLQSQLDDKGQITPVEEITP